jgi:hypothetical protein
MWGNHNRFALATFTSSTDLTIVQNITSDAEQLISSLSTVQCILQEGDEFDKEEKEIDLAHVLNELSGHLERRGMQFDMDFIDGVKTDIFRCILFYGRSRKVIIMTIFYFIK